MKTLYSEKKLWGFMLNVNEEGEKICEVKLSTTVI